MDIISLNEAATANSRIEIINANPDSTSGIITTPKTIASGETVTIPSGRVAVLPNTIVEGNVVVEAGAEIFVPAGAMYGSRVMYEKINYIATQGQTVFSVNYDLGSVDVYVNGIRLANTDFTATTLTSVTLTSGLNAGDIVELVSFGAFTVADTYTKAETDNALNFKVDKELVTITTGTATFTATTNNINLTGIGVGVEIGDVIQISGAEDAKNNSEFTVEVITDTNNIIVNQAHANKDTSKNVAARASDTGVTVKLLAKWYNAPIGLGQDWVTVKTIRVINTVYTNNTNRTISVSIYGNSGSSNPGSYSVSIKVNGVVLGLGGVHNASFPGGTVYTNLSKNDTYSAENWGGNTTTDWLELR